ncbi:30S ribosomal protein S6 [Tannockella kyphosi]|uniref:30S ribosomal protein S6 n=1 Tax=Tannockella kyphosi TaxID=2899121 RepID=UPI002010F7F8|nr:30S ribosomal protein S6 [Tannockella kyphosi]
MNKYEIMFIVKPDVEEEARNTVIETLKAILATDNGTIDSVNEWGLRDLAYEVKKFSKGYYVVIETTTTPANIKEFDRISKINDSVLRQLTLRK